MEIRHLNDSIWKWATSFFKCSKWWIMFNLIYLHKTTVEIRLGPIKSVCILDSKTVRIFPLMLLLCLSVVRKYRKCENHIENRNLFYSISYRIKQMDWNALELQMRGNMRINIHFIFVVPQTAREFLLFPHLWVSLCARAHTVKVRWTSCSEGPIHQWLIICISITISSIGQSTFWTSSILIIMFRWFLIPENNAASKKKQTFSCIK